VRKVDKMRMGNVWECQNKIEDKIKISERVLIEGGAAMLKAENKNHHSVKVGKRTIKPLFINKLRENNIS
jgi:hypothetical protein